MNKYDPHFVQSLFDNMSGSYERVNYITSFGFSARWRKQCVKALDIQPNEKVADLMTGMGECWSPILRKLSYEGQLVALDFSQGMIDVARKRMANQPECKIEVLHESVFGNSIPDESIDKVVSGFGIKTFNQEQTKKLAVELHRILKPNGRFSLIEISVPQNKLLSLLYMPYLKFIIPFLGWLFLGNPQDYRMLGIYTGEFGSCKKIGKAFSSDAWIIEYRSYFFGCATGIVGRKTTANSA